MARPITTHHLLSTNYYPPTTPSVPPFVQFRSITKTFGGVTALAEVSLDLARG